MRSILYEASVEGKPEERPLSHAGRDGEGFAAIRVIQLDPERCESCFVLPAIERSPVRAAERAVIYCQIGLAHARNRRIAQLLHEPGGAIRERHYSTRTTHYARHHPHSDNSRAQTRDARAEQHAG